MAESDLASGCTFTFAAILPPMWLTLGHPGPAGSWVAAGDGSW